MAGESVGGLVASRTGARRLVEVELLVDVAERGRVLTDVGSRVGAGVGGGVKAAVPILGLASRNLTPI
jgi:hypothetical protein